MALAPSAVPDVMRGHNPLADKSVQKLAVIGAPTSAGAYAPGQEKAPDALRAAGLLARLAAAGLACTDHGNVPGFRWEADRPSPRAMNVAQVAAVARRVAAEVTRARNEGRIPLVLGGDCTVELGTVAGTLASPGSVGLIYVDLDTDLNTPETTTDGALDWMGVAHMLALPGTIEALSGIAGRAPMLTPQSVLLFGAANIERAEAAAIDRLGIALVPARDVADSPETAADRALHWARPFERVLIHLDVDVIDFEDFPLAENVRRKCGLGFDPVMRALGRLLSTENLAGLTICEINPDHGAADGSTLTTFCRRLADAFAAGSALRGSTV